MDGARPAGRAGELCGVALGFRRAVRGLLFHTVRPKFKVGLVSVAMFAFGSRDVLQNTQIGTPAVLQQAFRRQALDCLLRLILSAGSPLILMSDRPFCLSGNSLPYQTKRQRSCRPWNAKPPITAQGRPKRSAVRPQFLPSPNPDPSTGTAGRRTSSAGPAANFEGLSQKRGSLF